MYGSITCNITGDGEMNNRYKCNPFLTNYSYILLKIERNDENRNTSYFKHYIIYFQRGERNKIR